MTPWRYIETAPLDAAMNMAIDEAIAVTVMKDAAPPTLRFFSWSSPAVTIGCFQRKGDIDAAFCAANRIDIDRRPTGGRAILHGDEITYSFSARGSDHPLFRSLMGSYDLLASAFLRAFRETGIDAVIQYKRRNGPSLSRYPDCFRTASYGELVVKSHKVVGSAQKRYRNGFLQQGSIPFRMDAVLNGRVFPASSGDLRGLTELHPGVDMAALKDALVRELGALCGARLVEGGLTEAELGLARRLAEERYRSPAWRDFR